MDAKSQDKKIEHKDTEAQRVFAGFSKKYYLCVSVPLCLLLKIVLT